MTDPNFAALNSQQCDELLIAAQHMTDVARKVASTVGRVDDPLDIEVTIISMCVAMLIAQEGSLGIDSTRLPSGTSGALLEARMQGAGAGIGQILGQMPERFIPRLIESVSRGIGEAIRKAMDRK